MSASSAKDAAISHDHEIHIHRWQERASSEPEQAVQGIVARLFLNCRDSLRSLVQHLEVVPDSRKECRTLRRCLKSLYLWSDGYGAASGALDATLDRSKGLRMTTLFILSSMCRAVSQGLKVHATTLSTDDDTARLCATATELYGQTRWLLTDYEDDCEGTDTNYSSSDEDEVENKLQDLVHDVKTYTDCLIDLGTALDCPALEPEHDDGPGIVTLEQRTGNDYHTDLIRAKFPDAEYCLLESLGRTSWHRYQRMQQMRDSNAHLDHRLPSSDKSQAASSEFQDSGIGTSLPRSVSGYAASVVSFISSISGGGRPNIPALSAEAKKGVPFECNACGKLIRATNSRDWRKHLYLDLQPYTCFFAKCKFTQEPFATRELWIDHLGLGHGLGPSWDSVQCPLCLDATEGGKGSILLHFAKHVEDIALASLPRDVDSDVESESGASSDHTEEATEAYTHNDNLESTDSTLEQELALPGTRRDIRSQSGDSTETNAVSGVPTRAPDLSTLRSRNDDTKGNSDDLYSVDWQTLVTFPESPLASFFDSYDQAGRTIEAEEHFKSEASGANSESNDVLAETFFDHFESELDQDRYEPPLSDTNSPYSRAFAPKLERTFLNIAADNFYDSSAQPHTNPSQLILPSTHQDNLSGNASLRPSISPPAVSHQEGPTFSEFTHSRRPDAQERGKSSSISRTPVHSISRPHTNLGATAATISPRGTLLDYEDLLDPFLTESAPTASYHPADEDPPADILEYITATDDDPDKYIEDAQHIPDSPPLEPWELEELHEDLEMRAALRSASRSWSPTRTEELLAAGDDDDRPSSPGVYMDAGTSWLCCECLGGPFEYSGFSRCSSCNHRRCGDCEMAEE